MTHKNNYKPKRKQGSKIEHKKNKNDVHLFLNICFFFNQKCGKEGKMLGMRIFYDLLHQECEVIFLLLKKMFHIFMCLQQLTITFNSHTYIKHNIFFIYFLKERLDGKRFA